MNPPVPPRDADSPYAGFWVRAAARFIDLLVILAVYNLFHLADRLGAGWGLWAQGGVAGASAGDRFSAANVLRGVFYLGFPVFYFVHLHASSGQTFGKMFLGIRVTGEDGSPLGCRKAMRRWLTEVVFGSVAGFIALLAFAFVSTTVDLLLEKMPGVVAATSHLEWAAGRAVAVVALLLVALPPAIMYLWAAFDRRKQGLHDKVSRTVVVRASRTSGGSAAAPAPHPPPPGPPPAFPPADPPDGPPAAS